MKQWTQWMVIGLMMTVLGGTATKADSFGVYFGNDGWGVNLNFGDYDYYDRYSPGYYDSGQMDFQAALNPYGAWQFNAEFGGDFWIPNVPAGWRPYSYGSWGYTSYGWTWTAYEPWGWIPHHYGNWMYHPSYQWIWIPGYTWSPAQVTWGFFNGYYGWAPLPPRHCAYYASHRHDHRRNYRDNDHHWYSRNSRDRGRSNYNESVGYYGDDSYDYIPNDAWVIVSANQFTNDNISEIALGRDQNAGLFKNRSFKPNNRAPEKQMIERETRRSVPVMMVDEVTKTVGGKAVKVVTPQKLEPARIKKISTVHQNFKRAGKNETIKTNTQQSRPDSVNRSNSSAKQKTIERPTSKTPKMNTQNPPRNNESGINRNGKTQNIEKPRNAVGKPAVRPSDTVRGNEQIRSGNKKAVNPSGKKPSEAPQGQTVRPGNNKGNQSPGKAVQRGKSTLNGKNGSNAKSNGNGQSDRNGKLNGQANGNGKLNGQSDGKGKLNGQSNEKKVKPAGKGVRPIEPAKPAAEGEQKNQDGESVLMKKN